MSLYQALSPRGVVKTVAICDRCRMRFNLVELRPDSDTPGLLVCKDCSDISDPYRKPARKSEVIAVRATRPDTVLEIPSDEEVVPTEDRPSLVMDFVNDVYSFEVD